MSVHGIVIQVRNEVTKIDLDHLVWMSNVVIELLTIHFDSGTCALAGLGCILTMTSTGSYTPLWNGPTLPNP